jgi:prepilin-type N-terminal cleavage/methylation domain-containing protein
MKSTKRIRGFTLVELIISAAALSLICALVLRLFLLSVELGDKAEIKQQAVMEAAGLMEVIKNAEKIDDVCRIDEEGKAEFEKILENGLVLKMVFEPDPTAKNKRGIYYDITIKAEYGEGIIYELEGGRYFASDQIYIEEQ